MKTLIKILVVGSLIGPSFVEASVGISEVKSAFNTVSFTSGALDSRFESNDRVVLERDAIESRRMCIEQMTGADEVLGHIQFTNDTVSLNFQF